MLRPRHFLVLLGLVLGLSPARSEDGLSPMMKRALTEHFATVARLRLNLHLLVLMSQHPARQDEIVRDRRVEFFVRAGQVAADAHTFVASSFVLWPEGSAECPKLVADAIRWERDDTGIWDAFLRGISHDLSREPDTAAAFFKAIPLLFRHYESLATSLAAYYRSLGVE